jgi:hypothetical protein
MLSHRVLNTIGSSALVVLGAGHLATSQFTPRSAARDQVVSAMEGFPVIMLGRTGNLYQYHTGFSLMMGVLLIAYGVLAFVAFRGRVVDPEADRWILAANVLVSAVAVAASVEFFFAVPIVLTTVALIAYASGLVMTLTGRRIA